MILVGVGSDAGSDCDDLVVGITRLDVAKLTTGDGPVSLELPYTLRVGRVFVVYGDSKPEILAQLEAGGVEIDAAHKAAAAEDPL